MMPTPTDVPDPQACEALRISEARYRRLFQTARDGILLLNEQTAQIEDVNPYLIEMLGYSHAEFLGKKLWEVGAFADIAQSKEMFAVLQVKGFVRYEDLPLKTKSGTPIAVEFVSNSYECEGIKVIQCNIRDITAHHEASRVLREFKAIVEASEDAIISKSLDGTIKSWNPGAERLFGYTAAEAIRRNMSLIVPPDRPEEEADILARVTRGERVEHIETVRRHKDGHLIDISATISPIRDNKGNVVGASKIARDITETKRAEAVRLSLESQLRESQKMEAIGTLAGGIAHDFNNIIATILGNVDLAMDDTADNPSAQKCIEEIRKAGRRARDLVQQILSFSRRQPLERKRIALQPILEETVRLIRSTFPANTRITLNCESSAPEVLADATQIEQALLNLATNAMQAAYGGSQTIEIRLETVVLDASFTNETPALRAMHLSRPARTVRLTVSDAGPGMDKATLARVFEPFFTTKPMGEGTGLGLSVVRGIIHGHEGAIVVASEPAKGTTFTIYLPIAKTQVSASVQDVTRDTPNQALASKGGTRLLYIDDDESMVLLVVRLLERRKYVVSGFSDATAAIEKLRGDPSGFDVVLSDYNMPYLSGLDVARAVRDIRADLPVAIVSGFIDERLLAQAKDAGVRELIVKTVDVTEFCESVQRLAESVSRDSKAP
jgi:two-component system cell cycle sensor histidine kinase/response regulator CckA